MNIPVAPILSLVAEASDGQDALVQYRSHRPNITSLDLQMPLGTAARVFP
jgi:CheY-like chemotaxis protein